MQIRDAAGNLLGVTANPLITKAPTDETFEGCFCVTRVSTVVATAHNGTSTGHLWLFNPSTNTKRFRIERVRISTQFGSALSVPTSPVTNLSRFTFTGTASGATVAPAAIDTTYTASADVRSASTGLTVTLVGGPFLSVLPVMAQGTAGWAANPPNETLWIPREEEYEIVLKPGEGIVIWQSTNGTTSDTRVVAIEVQWEEYTPV